MLTVFELLGLLACRYKLTLFLQHATRVPLCVLKQHTIILSIVLLPIIPSATSVILISAHDAVAHIIVFNVFEVLDLAVVEFEGWNLVFMLSPFALQIDTWIIRKRVLNRCNVGCQLQHTIHVCVYYMGVANIVM